MQEFIIQRTGQGPLSFEGEKLAEVTNARKAGKQPPEPGQPWATRVGPHKPGHVLSFFKTTGGKFVAVIAWTGDVFGAGAESAVDVQDDAPRAFGFFKSHDVLDEAHSREALKAYYRSNPRPSPFQPSEVSARLACEITDVLDAYRALVTALETALASERIA